MVHALAAAFNGDASVDEGGAPDRGASKLEAGVFYAFEDAALDNAPPPRVEVRFDDDGDDGGHANRATLVFDDPATLADFFAYAFASTKSARTDTLAVVAVVNGFLPPRADDGEDDDQGHGEDAANHEVAVALDLKGQGILCDVRLRLRALEKPMRHLGSLAFLADASSHEEILLPVWPDVAHYDGFATNIAAPDPRPDPRTRNSLDGAKPLRMKRDYTHPPNWGHTV